LTPESATPAATSRDASSAALAVVARAGEPDRYLAALLAPSPAREALLALAAFAGELARVPRLVVREPAMGDIRLQWWRDALELPDGVRTGHPVADALRAAARSHRLPAGLLAEPIAARALELRADPFPTEAALGEYLWKAEGCLFALASHILRLPAGEEAEAACRAGGHAYGLARLLAGLPRSLALGRVPLAQPQIAEAGLTPQELLAGPAANKLSRLLARCRAEIDDSLAATRRFVRGLSRSQRVAFLPLALVGSYLRALDRVSALREEAHVAPFARVCRIGAAHVLGRL
jgi:phytoene synthase